MARSVSAFSGRISRTLRVSMFLSVSLAALTIVQTPAQAQVSAPGARSGPISELDETDSGLGDIVVTATRTGETSAQRTPIAVTSLTGETLERSNIRGTEALSQQIPNLQIAQNNTLAQIYVRGVGSNNIFNGSDPTVIVNIDGVYIARPFGQFANFIDVASVEVLRGPQGTLYGRNAVGGAINVTSRVPGETWSGELQLRGGTYDEFGVSAFTSGPLIADKLAISIAGSYYRHDGYRKNVTPGSPDLESADDIDFRGQVRLTPTENLSLTTRVDASHKGGTVYGTLTLLQPYYLLPAPPTGPGVLDPLTAQAFGDYKKVAARGPNEQDITARGISEDISYEVSPALTLRSITAYRRNNMYFLTNSEGTSIGYNFTQLKERSRQFSQEFTASGRSGGFAYVGGLFYFDERTTSAACGCLNSRSTTSRSVYPTVFTKSYAAYGNLSYELTPAITVTVGNRYTRERKQIDQFGGLFSKTTGRNSYVPGPGQPAFGPSTYTLKNTYDSMTPKVALQVQLSPTAMVYASASRGWKSGGYNFNLLPITATTPLIGFAPEKVWSYEAGIKSEWFDRRLRLNLTGFHYDYSDLQVQAFISPGVTNISNAASAKIKGLEFEAEARPVKDLRFGVNASLLRARYDRYPGAPTTGTNTINASGNRLNNAPPYSGNVFVDFSPGNFWLRAEHAFVGRKYFTVANTSLESQRAYAVSNLLGGVDLDSGRLSLQVYAQNIFDKEYLTQTGSFSAVIAGRAGAPRTVGVKLTLRR